MVRCMSTQTAYLYFDAVGRADDVRWWGALAAVGDSEDDYLGKRLSELKTANADLLEPNGELKGRSLVHAKRDKALGDAYFFLAGRPIYFWPRLYPRFDDPAMRAIGRDFVREIDGLRPSRLLAPGKQVKVASHSKRMATYIKELKRNPKNLAKLTSIITHSVEIVAHLQRTGHMQALNRVQVAIDRENFPHGPISWILKWWLAAEFQGNGMSYKITGSAADEPHFNGAIVVNADADSAAHHGLQYVDILLHGWMQKAFGNVAIPPKPKLVI